MQVIVERDSVCMGDDCLAPHTRVYTLHEDATYVELMECLNKDRYLPSVSGNNVVWVLTNEHYSCIFSYFTKTDTLSSGLTERLLKTICKDSNQLKFKYFSGPQKWRDGIYRMYNNDESAMWKDGWREEIRYCDYVMSL